MAFISSSALLSRTLANTGIIETYEEGIIVRVESEIFTLTKDTAMTLSYYFNDKGMDVIELFDVLTGTVDTPEDMAIKWLDLDGNTPPLCHIHISLASEEGNWAIGYSRDSELDDPGAYAIILGSDLFEKLLQDCENYCLHHHRKVVDQKKLWLLRGRLPASGASIVTSISGVDLIFPDQTIFAASGAAAGGWRSFCGYAGEMLEERLPGSYRLSVPFGKVGLYDLCRLEEGILVNFFQLYQNTTEQESPSVYPDDTPVYTGTIEMGEADIQMIGLSLTDTIFDSKYDSDRGALTRELLEDDEDLEEEEGEHSA